MTTQPGRLSISPRVLNAGSGALVGLLVKELGLVNVLPVRPHPHIIIGVLAGLGILTGSTHIRRAMTLLILVLGTLWLIIVLTPFTNWAISPLLREDKLESADAVFVLSSGLQSDGDLTPQSMTRLLHGLEVIQQGYAPQMIISETAAGSAGSSGNRDAVVAMADRLQIPLEHISVVEPVFNTRDEAVLVAEHARALGLKKIIVVSSPTHLRRAGALLEKVGLQVVVSPCTETQFDIENLGALESHGDRLRAFGSIAHEYAGLVYYRLRGWI